MVQTFDEYDLAAYFLRCLRSTRNPEVLKVVVCWKRQESGHRIRYNDPFNTGTIFPTLWDGIITTTDILQEPQRNFNKSGSLAIKRAFDIGDPLYIIQAISQSSWNADKYGTTIGGKSRILIEYERWNSYQIDETDGPIGPLPRMNPEYDHG